ncbi:hypothetical protein [Mitsuokella multacida]|uniref:hypothetical protein n=1 Tax=Mitsuokella multacida TaxID=52226 RepID=UPI00241C7C0D|nr:hypothetical protein [Mitsuokella multacida]
MRKQDTYVTYVPDNPRDAIRYSNQVDYWDADTKTYYILGKKKRTSVWNNVEYRALMDGSYSDMGRLLDLMCNVERDNAISFYNERTRRKQLATSWEDLRRMLDMAAGSGAWKRFARKLKTKGIVREMIIKGVNGSPDIKHLYLSPLIGMGSLKITLDCYKLFQPELDKVLPARAINDLQRHWREESGEIEPDPEPRALDTACVDAEPVITDPAPENSAPASNTEPEMSDKERLSIYKEYVLGGKIQMYQLRNNGMFATTQPDKSKDLWYTPNRVADAAFKSGRKKAAAKEITIYNDWYIDIDAGKDAEGNYYDLAEVTRRKQDMLAVIALLPQPTAVVETRNGYHIYWSCYEVKDLDTWQAVESKLIDIVRIADPHARDVARLLRVPYSTWYKIPSEPYKIRLVSAARNQYPAADMIAMLDGAAETIAAACVSYNNKYGLADRAPKKAANTVRKSCTNSQPTAETPDNDNIRAVRNLEIPANVVAMPLVPYTGNIAKEIKSKISMADLLSLDYGRVFRCILDDHVDNHPSAMLYKNEGGDRYVCSCLDRRGIDVIDLVQRLARCTYTEAVGYLGKLIGIYSPVKIHAPKKSERIENLIDKRAGKDLPVNY